MARMAENVATTETTTSPAATTRLPWLLVIVAFGSMLVFGFAENIKGTLIPPIREAFQVSYADIGVMLFIGSFGYLSATFVGGLAGDRYGQKRVIGAGFILILLSGFGMLMANSFSLVCLFMYTLNAGFGCQEVGVNSLGARIFVRNSALMMNLTHFFYGVGSMVGPEYAARMLLGGRAWGEVYAIACCAVIIVFVILVVAKFPVATDHHSNRKLAVSAIARDKKVWLFIGVLGLMVVVELGTGNWLISYLRGAYGMSTEESARYLSLFFVFFTLGRLFGGYIVERVGYVKTVFSFGVMILLLDVGAFALGRSAVFLFSLTGFCVSIMYPTFMALIMKEFRVGTGSVMGFVITAVAGVNMLMNWVVGQTAEILGVTAGFSSFMLYLVIALGLLLLLNRRLTFNKPLPIAPSHKG